MSQAGRAPSLEVEVKPPWPYRLPRSSGGDGVLRSPRKGIACRLLHVDGEPVDEHFSEFRERFKLDPLVGPAISKRPWHRPRRRPWPWEALAWAVTSQLIEAFRAAAIQRRIVRRWGPRREMEDGVLRDVASAALVAGRAPAELASMDLAASRALALICCAKEVSAGRVDLHSPSADRRLRRISGIGPWTLQCLGFGGRGDPRPPPAGHL